MGSSALTTTVSMRVHGTYAYLCKGLCTWSSVGAHSNGRGFMKPLEAYCELVSGGTDPTK